jgi:hypothetical protein
MGAKRESRARNEAPKGREADMAKGKGGGSYPNPKGHTGPKTQFPQARRPPSSVVPRVVPRTKASPKGR